MSGSPKRSVQGDRTADDLRQVGHDDDDLGLRPQQNPTDRPGSARALCSARLIPVTMPSLAARYWITIAEQLAKTTTQTRA